MSDNSPPPIKRVAEGEAVTYMDDPEPHLKSMEVVTLGPSLWERIQHRWFDWSYRKRYFWEVAQVAHWKQKLQLVNERWVKSLAEVVSLREQLNETKQQLARWSDAQGNMVVLAKQLEVVTAERDSLSESAGRDRNWWTTPAGIANVEADLESMKSWPRVVVDDPAVPGNLITYEERAGLLKRIEELKGLEDRAARLSEKNSRLAQSVLFKDGEARSLLQQIAALKATNASLAESVGFSHASSERAWADNAVLRRQRNECAALLHDIGSGGV